MSGLIHTAFWAYEIIVIIRVVFSWVRVAPYSPWSGLQRFVHAATEPPLRPIRRLLAPYQGRTGFDFSPLVLLVLLRVIEPLVISVSAGPVWPR